MNTSRAWKRRLRPSYVAVLAAGIAVVIGMTAMPAAANQPIRVFANTTDVGDWTAPPSVWAFSSLTPPGVTYPDDDSTYAYQVSISAPVAVLVAIVVVGLFPRREHLKEMQP